MFTVPRPKYVVGSGISDRLSKALIDPSPQQLQALDSEVAVELPDMKRPKRVVSLGFFEQGIVTGLVMVLTTAVAGTGVAGYYLVGYLRSRHS